MAQPSLPKPRAAASSATRASRGWSGKRAQARPSAVMREASSIAPSLRRSSSADCSALAGGASIQGSWSGSRPAARSSSTVAARSTRSISGGCCSGRVSKSCRV